MSPAREPSFNDAVDSLADFVGLASETNNS